MGFISKKIKTAREENNLTQQQLADLVDVNIKTISRIEHGQTKTIKNELVQKFSKIFKVPVSYFYNDLSVSDKKDVSSLSVSNSNLTNNTKKNTPFSKNVPKSKKDVSSLSVPSDDDVIFVPIISHNASAGTSSDIYDIEVYDTQDKMAFSPLLFKTPQKAKNLRTTKVDGYSMIPMLCPDTWVIFDITKKIYDGDGLYILNFRNVLMVKMLQITDKGTLAIISVNKDYQSWDVDVDDQSVFRIFGKVLKIIK